LPILKNAIDLTVAIKLIAEKISKDQNAGGDGLYDLGEGGFIHFKNRDGLSGPAHLSIGKSACDQSGGDPTHQI